MKPAVPAGQGEAGRLVRTPPSLAWARPSLANVASVQDIRGASDEVLDGIVVQAMRLLVP